MKKNFKTTLALALALVLVLSYNVAAFAAEVPDATSEDYGVAPCSENFGWGVAVGTTWKTVATSTTGFNCNVEISSKNAATSTTHIRMLDKNGNVVWSENAAIAFQDTRIFACGSNVYTIQACAATGMTSIYCSKTTEPADHPYVPYE